MRGLTRDVWLQIEMTDSLKLVVDFLRTKKLDRSCDLLMEARTTSEPLSKPLGSVCMVL